MALARLIQPEDIHVLLIEDAAGDAAAVTRAMIYGESLYNFIITQKETLADGLEYLRSATADIVMLDLNLPDAKEHSAVEKLHAAFPDLPIVVISGYSDMVVVSKALRGGAQEFLIKGECSGAAIRQSIYQAMVRKQIEMSYKRGERL